MPVRSGRERLHGPAMCPTLILAPVETCPYGGRRAALPLRAVRTNLLTSVRCAGQWATVGVGIDAGRGTVLRLDLLPTGKAATLAAWVQEVASKLESEVLVSNDADGSQGAANAAVHRRYLGPAKPPKDGTTPLAYQLRLSSRDRWTLGAVDAVPDLARAGRRSPGRDHQHLRAGDRLVGPRTLPHHVRLQAGVVRPHREPSDRGTGQCPRRPRLCSCRSSRVSEQGTGRPLPGRLPPESDQLHPRTTRAHAEPGDNARLW